MAKKAAVQTVLAAVEAPVAEKPKFLALAVFRTRLSDGLRCSQEGLAKFSADLAKDPAFALTWGTKAFAFAAQAKVYAGLLGWMDESAKRAADGIADDGSFYSATLEAMHKEALRNALRGAASPARSTSITSNLMETEIVACWANTAEELAGLICVEESMSKEGK